MKQSLKKVKDLQKMLLALEMDMDLLSRELHIVCHNISQLQKIEGRLTKSIRMLKQDKIITIASEYKRMVEELQYVQYNLGMFMQTKEVHRKELLIKTNSHKEYIERLDTASKTLDQEKVVLMWRKDHKEENER